MKIPVITLIITCLLSSLTQAISQETPLAHSSKPIRLKLNDPYGWRYLGPNDGSDYASISTAPADYIFVGDGSALQTGQRGVSYKIQTGGMYLYESAEGWARLDDTANSDKYSWKIEKVNSTNKDEFIRHGDVIRLENVYYPDYYLCNYKGNYAAVGTEAKIRSWDKTAEWVVEFDIPAAAKAQPTQSVQPTEVAKPKEVGQNTETLKVQPDIYDTGAQFTTEFFDVVYTIYGVNPQIKGWDSTSTKSERGVYLNMPNRGYLLDGPLLQVIPSDYMLLGDYGYGDKVEKEGSDEQKKGAHYNIALRAKAKYRDQNLLAAPVRFEQVWTDKGSGATKDVAIWRMIPPDGYVALGMVFTNGPAPDLNGPYRCVKETANFTNKEGVVDTKSLVWECGYVSDSDSEEKPLGFWDDRGSGVEADVALYKIGVSKEFKPPKSTVLLIPNVFFATNEYGKFPNDKPFVLTLFAEDSGVSDRRKEPTLPQLTSLQEKLEPVMLTDTFTLPYYKIKDDKYSSSIEQALMCPFYTVTRTSYYHPVVDTIGAANDSKISWSVEKSNSASSNWSVGASIEISAGFAIEATGSVNPLGVGGSTTVTKSAGIAITGSTGFGGETSTGTAQTGSLEVPVNNGQRGVIFEVRQEYVVKRSNGTEVTSYNSKSVDHSMKFQSALFPPNAIASDQFSVIVSGPEDAHLAFPNKSKGQRTSPLFFVSGEKLGDSPEQFTKVKIERVPAGDGLKYAAFRVRNFSSRGVNRPWLSVDNKQNLVIELAEGTPTASVFKVGEYEDDYTSLWFKSMWSGLPKDSGKNPSYYMTNNTGDAEPVKIVKFADDGLGQLDDSTQNIVLTKEK
ncbi:MAG: Vps62-related protein [Planctomycetaceae bacterium]|nr:Vps62-related protein [Planctomycetaceae bacterium]